MKTITVTVTKRDIMTSVYTDNCGCALFKSLKRNGHDVKIVYSSSVVIGDYEYSIDAESVDELPQQDTLKESKRPVRSLKVTLSK